MEIIQSHPSPQKLPSHPTLTGFVVISIHTKMFYARYYLSHYTFRMQLIANYDSQ